MKRNQLNILIVEDEMLIAEMLKGMLIELNYNVLAIAKKYKEAITFLNSNKTINFVILDINLSEQKTGIDIGDKLNTLYKIPFIYLTAYSGSNTFSKAVTTKPEAYLIKPFNKSDIFTTIELIRFRKKENEEFVFIETGHLKVKIFLKDILWLKSDKNYIEIIAINKKYLVRDSLNHFLKKLQSSNFVQIHRSYIVNINKIDVINGQYVIIGKEKLPLSRKYKDNLYSVIS